MWRVSASMLLLAMSVSGSRVGQSSFLALAKNVAKDGFGQNPISKVADMLESMATEIEDDKKAEQDLFDKYECWWKTVCGAKKASIHEAEETISALTAYIDDISSGRIEFSSEGADATKDVAELMTELEKSKALRTKENEDFDAAKDEMQTTIGALERALEELEAGTELLAGKTTLKKKVLAEGKAMLDANKAQLLELAFGESRGGLGSPDYKKLNKKREFNEKYTMRSGKIQDLIADMLQTFKDNLDEAEDKEKSSKEQYEKLKEAKEDQLKQAKNALESLGGETASRDEAKEEANQEISTLEDQIKKDNDVIDEVTKAYDEKLKEWKERKKLMTLEISSISQALSILRSDDARDAMTTAFDKNKVYSFAQVAVTTSSTERHQRLELALKALRTNAKKEKGTGRRLWATARRIELAVHKEDDGRFDKVIEILNNVKKDLMKESKDDKKKKGKCDTTLTEKTEEAQTSANIIDEKSRVINRTKFEVVELQVEVNKTVDEVVELEWELNDATLQRASMNEAFAKEKVGLEAAIDFIGQAKKTLEKYYDDHQSFVQIKRLSQPDLVVEAGKDAPPPPPTVTKPYKGHGNNKGIQGMLGDIQSDVQGDLDDLEKNEKDSVKDFEDTKSDLEGSIEAKMDYKKETEKQIAGKLEDISAENSAKIGEQDTLDAVVESLKAAEPSCNYVFTTYETRIDNRKVEAEGIDNAMSALGGDPDEVKFKDAAKEK